MDGSKMAGRQHGKLRVVSQLAEPRTGARAPTVTESPLADYDTQLMLRAAEGDREAASKLAHRNHDRIARYIGQLIHDRRAVEDLTQDVFLQALSHANQYRPTAKVVTWLYRIATNTARNYLKQADLRRRKAAAPPEAALHLPDPHEPPPDRQLSLDELKEQVARAIRELPINQRIALTLRQYEDCSYEQIAAVLDSSIEAVRSLLSRARQRLQTTLRGLM